MKTAFSIGSCKLSFLSLCTNHMHILTNMHRRANQLLSQPKSDFGSLTFCHRSSINQHFLTNTKQLTLKYVHDFICYVRKVYFMFFPSGNSEWPKNWSWLKNWFSLLYVCRFKIFTPLSIVMSKSYFIF